MTETGSRAWLSDVKASDLSRCVVATYFIGLGFGYLPGTHVGALFQLFLPEVAAGYAASALVIALASLIFLNFYKIAAACGLALLIFAASYLGIVTIESDVGLVWFWRDMASLAFLFFAVRPDRSASANQSAQRSRHLNDTVTPAAHASANMTDPISTPARPHHPRRVRSELYRQDLEFARPH